MYFSPQKNSYSCAICCYKMVIKNSNYNYKTTKIKLYSTKSIPISTLSLLFSDNLVENKIEKSYLRSLESISNFPIIIHVKKFLVGHYIVIFKKIGNKFLVGDPLKFGIRVINKRKIEKNWSGYYIYFTNLFLVEGKRRFYIPYSILFFFKFLFIVLVITGVFLLKYFFIML